MRKLLGILLLLLWPVVVIGSWIHEGEACGWQRSLWEDAICKAPDKARNHGNLGMVYMENGQYNKGLEHLEIAESIAREHPTVDSDAQHVGPAAVSSMAAFYLETRIPRNLEKADQILETARNHYPANEGVLANSIELLLLRGDVERAEDFAEAALRELPHSPWMYVQSAEVAALLGECDRRARLLLGAFKQEPMIRTQIERGTLQLRPCLDGGAF